MIYDTIKSYLEKEPRARERREHSRAIVNLLLIKYPSLKEIPKSTLIDFARDYDSYIREWREVVRLEPHLRGKDWKDGKRLSQETQLKRGYEPGFEASIRRLKTI